MTLLKIRELRKSKGWSMKTLSKKFKEPKCPKTISRWEKGKCMPRKDSLIELSCIFDIEINELFHKNQQTQ